MEKALGMKYIRTNYGIAKLRKKIKKVYLEGKLIEEETILLDQYDKEIPNDYTKLVVKQADTIEELCDEFVVVREKQKPIPFANLEQVRLNRGNYGFSNSIVYGAVWTDKGLIYVAKMNERGELELL